MRRRRRSFKNYSMVGGPKLHPLETPSAGFTVKASRQRSVWQDALGTWQRPLVIQMLGIGAKLGNKSTSSLVLAAAECRMSPYAARST